MNVCICCLLAFGTASNKKARAVAAKDTIINLRLTEKQHSGFSKIRNRTGSARWISWVLLSSSIIVYNSREHYCWLCFRDSLTKHVAYLQLPQKQIYCCVYSLRHWQRSDQDCLFAIFYQFYNSCRADYGSYCCSRLLCHRYRSRNKNEVLFSNNTLRQNSAMHDLCTNTAPLITIFALKMNFKMLLGFDWRGKLALCEIASEFLYRALFWHWMQKFGEIVIFWIPQLTPFVVENALKLLYRTRYDDTLTYTAAMHDLVKLLS